MQPPIVKQSNRQVKPRCVCGHSLNVDVQRSPRGMEYATCECEHCIDELVKEAYNLYGVGR